MVRWLCIAVLYALPGGLLAGCVDPDQFEQADAEADMAQVQADRGDPLPVDGAPPEPDMARVMDSMTPDDSAVDAGDAGADADPDAEADAIIDAEAPEPDAAPIETCEVTWTVTLPEGTPEGPLHLAGTFTGSEPPDWNPGDPALELTRDGDTATFTREYSNGDRIEYKYTRGAWEAVEVNQDCSDVEPNRVARVGCNEGTFEVADRVAAWADTCQ